MKRILALFILIIFGQVAVIGQSFQKNMEMAMDTQANPLNPKYDSVFYHTVYDPQYGINIYENLNYRLGGDSSRMDNKGYAARGWLEDYYPGGSILHRGYYNDGHLKIYRNFYPDGTIERSYRTMDNYQSSMDIFYSDGTLRSRVVYSEGVPMKWEDFYPSGKLEYTEEFNKTLDYYLSKRSFYMNGKLDESLLLVKESKHLYESKKFSASGKLEKEGKVVFNESAFDYRKIGKWSIYDTTGRLFKEEFYIDGVLDKEKSL
jgi:antitoxin component YwqK of YwqJK toxin-antitoxin module